jgi:hypothetical protein
MQLVENKVECGQIVSESRYFECVFAADLFVVSRQGVLVVGVSRISLLSVFAARGDYIARRSHDKPRPMLPTSELIE